MALATAVTPIATGEFAVIDWAMPRGVYVAVLVAAMTMVVALMIIMLCSSSLTTYIFGIPVGFGI